MTAREDLRALCHALRGPAFAQGAGGNVSVKESGTLFVKASGIRLEAAAAPGGHALVPLDLAVRALEGDAAAEKALFAITPRPSMETFFHALPARLVVHVHSVGMLLAACAPEGAVPFVGPRVPYHPPGRALALAVRATTVAPHASVLLESHGVLLFDESVGVAIERLEQLEAAALDRFPDAPPFAEYLGAYLGPSAGSSRKLPDRRPFTGYLFPDAIVYAPAVEVDDIDTATALGVLQDDTGSRRMVARSAAALDGACEIVAAHDWVEDVLEAAGVTPLRLPRAAVEALRADPAEAYRQRRVEEA